MVDDADRIAIDQCLWWASQDIAPSDALASIGLEWPGKRPPTWHDVQLAVALTWRLLPTPAPADRRQGKLRLVMRNG